MAWTKRQLVSQALEEIGLADYVFDLTDEDLQSALRKLDTMMATWNAKGLRLAFPLPDSPTDSDLDDDSNLPDAANEAVYLNLACRIAPSYGKQVMRETKQYAKMAYSELHSKYSTLVEMQLPGETPAGAGNKPWRTHNNQFLSDPEDPLAAGNDSLIEI